MRCKNCGKGIANGADICPECGGNLLPNVPSANPRAVLLKEETDHAIIWYLKKKAVYAAILVLAVLVAGVHIFIAAISFFNRIDFTEYVVMEASGYNGRGTLHIAVDMDALSHKLFKRDPFDLDEEQARKLGLLESLLMEGIKNSGKTTMLSNEDQITLKISNLTALGLAAERHCKENDTISYLVEGLKEGTVLPFQDLFDVTFTGSNGAGCVLVAPRAEGIPWPVASNYNGFCIDGYDYSLYSDSGNAGALSNGDTFTIGIAPIQQEFSDYFLESYGSYISTEEASYTVSGLSDAQTVDVMSMIEFVFSGVDGSGEIGYRWKQEEYQYGNIRIVPRDSESNTFSLYVKSTQTENSITALAKSNDIPQTEQDLGWFLLEADKTRDISLGDTITVTLHSDYFDPADSDMMASYGIKFSAIQKAIQVDAAMLPRYITSSEQVNETNMLALAEEMAEAVRNGLNNDWSYIVHGNSNYACYDREMVGGPMAEEARLICSDKKSNTYTIWIVYVTVVTDSELDEPSYVFTTVRIDRPVVYQDETDTISYGGNVRLEYTTDWERIYDSGWYQNEDGLAIYF